MTPEERRSPRPPPPLAGGGWGEGAGPRRTPPPPNPLPQGEGEKHIAAAVLEIDLAAIVANWRLLCTLHPSGPVAGVVKADGYGLGARHVAPALLRRRLPALLRRLAGRGPGDPPAGARCDACRAGRPDRRQRSRLYRARHRPGARLARRDRCLDLGRAHVRPRAAGDPAYRYRHVAARSRCARAGAAATGPRTAGRDRAALRDDPPCCVRGRSRSAEPSDSASASPPPAPGCRRHRAVSPIHPASSWATAGRPTWRGRVRRSTASTRPPTVPTRCAWPCGCARACWPCATYRPARASATTPRGTRHARAASPPPPSAMPTGCIAACPIGAGRSLTASRSRW